MILKHTILAALGRLGALLNPVRQGVVGERLAARYLRRLGYRVLGRNLRNRFGEVDILAEAPDGRTIVVVEVKSRGGVADSGLDEESPERRVGVHKQRQLVALACQMTRRYRLTQRPIRFDVVGVDLPQGAVPVIRHHIGAFQSHV